MFVCLDGEFTFGIHHFAGGVFQPRESCGMESEVIDTDLQRALGQFLIDILATWS